MPSWLNTAVRVIWHTHWKVKVAVIATVAALLLTPCLDLLLDRLGTVVLFLSLPFSFLFFGYFPFAASPAPPPPTKKPRRDDKTWLAWMQIESIFQLYLNLQWVVSVATSVVVLNMSRYAPWDPLAVLLLPEILFVCIVWLVLQIIRGRPEGSPIPRSRYGGAFFAFLAEALIKAGKREEAVKYIRYCLQEDQEHFEEDGFRLKSIPRVVAILGVTEGRQEEHPVSGLEDLASFLAALPAYSEYRDELGTFLDLNHWHTDMEILSEVSPRPSFLARMLRPEVIAGLSALTGVIVASIVTLWPAEVRAAISAIGRELPTTIAGLLEQTLPGLLWFIALFGFLAYYSSRIEYEIPWRDIAFVSETP
jgi:hypothetical protein